MADVVYDKRAITAFLASLQRPWGVNARIAEALHLESASVSAWFTRKSCPGPEYWPTIEHHLGLDQGKLAEIGKAYESEATVAVIATGPTASTIVEPWAATAKGAGTTPVTRAEFDALVAEVAEIKATLAINQTYGIAASGEQQEAPPPSDKIRKTRPRN